jgi:hypothetical protein
MKTFKFLSAVLIGAFALTYSSCTKLDETPYSTILEENYFKTKTDVIGAVMKGYERAGASVGDPWYNLQEDGTDEMMTPNRQGHWIDGQNYYRMHYHTWTVNDAFTNNFWNNSYNSISTTNNAMELLQELEIAKFGITDAERKQLIAELRVTRAWYHLRLFDFYRKIVISTKYKGADPAPLQSSPAEISAFIEKELKEAMVDLPVRGAQANYNGRWTKGGAMSILVRLYLNSKVWVGVDRYAECAVLADNIIKGTYGTYALESNWDAPFDSKNENSLESVMAFPQRLGFTNIHYVWAQHFSMPFKGAPYFQVTANGGGNPKYAMQPSLDVDGKEYPFALGKPFAKFKKYGDDVRLKLYKNLGGGKREGMFLFGTILDPATNKPIQSDNGYDLYIRDQVGLFNRVVNGKLTAYGPSEVNPDKRSDIAYADQNSGVYPVKYPIYPTTDVANSLESDYAEIRLAEIYYSLAECKFRAGDKAGASVLLNVVRKRNYPANSASLYEVDGSELTEQELLDEWGREFIVEGRRRTDLVRWDKYTTGTWWDKTPDKDGHTNIFPIGLNVLGTSPQLVQNPGYQ